MTTQAAPGAGGERVSEKSLRHYATHGMDIVFGDAEAMATELLDLRARLQAVEAEVEAWKGNSRDWQAQATALAAEAKRWGEAAGMEQRNADRAYEERRLANARADALAAALEQYGRHKKGCHARKCSLPLHECPNRCTCGLDQALATARAGRG